MEETKKCSQCKIEKSIEDFRFKKKGLPKRNAYCKPCGYKGRVKWAKKNKEKVAQIKKEYREKNRSKLKMMNIKSRYGLNPDQYSSLLEAQNNSCSICKKKKKLFVDHCHSSGAVRGLLCHSCNSGIGFLGDTEESLKRAFKYLETANKKNNSN